MSNTEFAMRNFFSSLIEKYDISNLYSRYLICAKKHPVLAALTGVAIAFYTVPIAVYVVFSIGAFIITFVGFLIILGVLLLVGFLVLAAALATITVIVVFVSLAIWFMNRVYEQLNQISETMNAEDEPHSTTGS